MFIPLSFFAAHSCSTLPKIYPTPLSLLQHFQTPPLHRVPVRHSDRSRNNRHKGLKRPNSLSRRDLQLHPLSHHSSHFIFSRKFFFLSPLQDPRSTLRRPTVLASSLPPNFPLSDGDVIAIWKTPPRTLRSLTDPDYAQLPAIALAIGRSVFRGCDCLNLVRRLRERQREKEWEGTHVTQGQPRRGQGFYEKGSRRGNIGKNLTPAQSQFVANGQQTTSSWLSGSQEIYRQSGPSQEHSTKTPAQTYPALSHT